MDSSKQLDITEDYSSFELDIAQFMTNGLTNSHSHSEEPNQHKESTQPNQPEQQNSSYCSTYERFIKTYKRTTPEREKKITPAPKVPEPVKQPMKITKPTNQTNQTNQLYHTYKFSIDFVTQGKRMLEHSEIEKIKKECLNIYKKGMMMQHFLQTTKLNGRINELIIQSRTQCPFYFVNDKYGENPSTYIYEYKKNNNTIRFVFHRETNVWNIYSISNDGIETVLFNNLNSLKDAIEKYTQCIFD